MGFFRSPMPPDHHHSRGVEFAVLDEQTTAVFAELRVGFVTKDEVLVDADRACAVGDGVLVALGVAERERGERFVGIARAPLSVELQVGSEPRVSAEVG